MEGVEGGTVHVGAGVGGSRRGKEGEWEGGRWKDC